tara:strand:- start:2119 stop:2397 length:279 start_codon:yes stop_codon:yes gene_type:complete
MKITRTSHASGVTRTLDLDITQHQLIDYEKGMKIQYAFPNLTVSEREFFMTGITEDEWNALFPEEDDDYGSPDEPDHGTSFLKNEGNYFDEN